MLELFKISNATDGDTVCSILVEPGRKQCSVTITVNRRITRMAYVRDARGTHHLYMRGDEATIYEYEENYRSDDRFA